MTLEELHKEADEICDSCFTPNMIVDLAKRFAASQVERVGSLPDGTTIIDKYREGSYPMNILGVIDSIGRRQGMQKEIILKELQ